MEFGSKQPEFQSLLLLGLTNRHFGSEAFQYGQSDGSHHVNALPPHAVQPVFVLKQQG